MTGIKKLRDFQIKVVEKHDSVTEKKGSSHLASKDGRRRPVGAVWEHPAVCSIWCQRCPEVTKETE